MEPSTPLNTFATKTARTGAALSETIFELLSAASYSPKEVHDVAKAVVDLSMSLDHLGFEWGATGPGIKSKRELERQVTSALESIATLYGDIRALIDPARAAARLLWAFRRARWRWLLRQAESYNAGVWTIMTTLSLAYRLKCTAVDCEDDPDGRLATARQQSEIWVQTCHQAIRLLAADYDERQRLDDAETEEADSQALIVDTRTESSVMYFARTRFIEDIIFWLYDVEFSSVAEGSRQHHLSGENAEEEDHTTMEAAPFPTSCSDYGSQGSRYVGKLRLLIRSPPNTPAVVNKLISRWTTLPKRHIYLMDPETSPEHKKSEPEPPSSPGSSSLDYDLSCPPPLDVLFTDARGRRYRIPWDIAKAWVGMEGLISHMFARVPGFWHGVMNGRYDVLGKGGIIMMPQTYDKLIMPGALLTMRMWPPDGSMLSRPPGPVGPMGPPPIGPPPESRSGSRRTRRAANSGRPVYVGS